MCPVDTGSSTRATSFEVLWSREAEWARRLQMVHDSRTFLYLSLFYLEYDTYGREMLDALLAAQQRGVRVQLIIDTFGQRLGGVLMNRAQRHALSAALQALEHAGGLVQWYRPPRWLQRCLAGGHHVKIQVSEAGEALLCSGNITKSSFDGWNECAVALRGDVVPVLLRSCRDIGGVVPDNDVTWLEARARQDHANSHHVAVDYWFYNPNLDQGPLGPLSPKMHNELTDQMVAMVDAAQRSLSLTSFYFKPTRVLRDAVIRAAKRGVHVEVHHSHVDALPATDLAWVAAAADYHALLEAGIHLYENRHGEHSKIVLVDEADEAWVAYGSYNFEDAAHDRLAEAMIATRDAVGVAPARAIFQSLRADPDNQRVTRETMAAWPDARARRVRRYGRFKRWM